MRRLLALVAIVVASLVPAPSAALGDQQSPPTATATTATPPAPVPHSPTLLETLIWPMVALTAIGAFAYVAMPKAGVAFFAASGSDFVELYVGTGAARVRDLFQRARAEERGAVVFIDEIDAIGRRRSDGRFAGSDEREVTLNQLLVELDGFERLDN